MNNVLFFEHLRKLEKAENINVLSFSGIENIKRSKDITISLSNNEIVRFTPAKKMIINYENFGIRKSDVLLYGNNAVKCNKTESCIILKKWQPQSHWL